MSSMLDSESDSEGELLDCRSCDPVARSAEIGSKQSLEKLKRFPRFTESLVFVSLQGPTQPVPIGNSVFVQYVYEHRVPSVHIKQYVPLTSAKEKYTRRHDASMMKNSKLPQEKIRSIVEAASRKSLSEEPCGADHRHWDAKETEILCDVMGEIRDHSRLNEVGSQIQARLREQLSSDRSLEDILANIRLHRLYSNLQSFDSVRLCPSERVHDPSDWIALVKLPARNSGEKEFIVDQKVVPSPNRGEVEFARVSLALGTYEFRYHLVGCSTPACISARFECIMPRCTIHVSDTALKCGQPFSLCYKVEITRPHCPQDCISIYKLGDCYGPSGCIFTTFLNPENEGSIQISDSLKFPGTYVAKYHLAQLGHAVAAVSEEFRARIQDKKAELRNREIRIMLCCTVCDMNFEREEIVKVVIPSLQAKFEDQLITITLVAPSEGMDEGNSHPKRNDESEYHLAVVLNELDRCHPFLIFLLGERYGAIPDKYDGGLTTQYPWLAVERNSDMLPGVRASIIEIMAINGVFVQPDGAKYALFCFRDADYPKRKGLDRDLFGLYRPISECYREVLCNLKEQIRRRAQSQILEYDDVRILSIRLLTHLEAAIENEYPDLKPLSRQEKTELATNVMHFAAIQDVDDYHPAFDQWELQTDDLFTSSKPVLITGKQGSGKTALICKLVEKYLHEIADQEGVTMTCTRGTEGLYGSATAYVKDGMQHLVLLQHVGLEMAISTDLDLLQNAMEVTNKVFGLNLSIAWNEKDIIHQIWGWLEAVCSKGVFIWIVDGIDHIISFSSIEAHSIVRDDAKSSTIGGNLRVKEDHSQPQEESVWDREMNGLSSARVKAQARLRGWLVPLLDDSNQWYAGKTFPTLHLMVSFSTPSNRLSELDPTRKIDPVLQNLLHEKLYHLRVVHIPSWTGEQKKKYFNMIVQRKCVHLPASAQEILIDVGNADEIFDSKGENVDPFANPLFATCFVREVNALCEVFAGEVLAAKLNALKAITSVNELCRYALQWRITSPTVESVLRYLSISRFGLREMELLALIKGKNQTSHESLLKILQILQPLTTTVFGFISLKPHFRLAMLRLHEAIDSKLNCIKKMSSFFEATINATRQKDELPLLLLRMGKLDSILEFLCTPRKFESLGKAEALRICKAAGFAHDVVASAMKAKFECEFQMCSGTGTHYELVRLERYEVTQGKHESERLLISKESAGFERDPNSRVRALRMEKCVERFCVIGLDIADMICLLDTRNLEVAEVIIEGILKMLHCSDSLMLASERPSKYPKWSQQCLISYANMFERAVHNAEMSEPNVNPRAEDLRLHQIRVMHDLIGSKVSLLVKIAEQVAADIDGDQVLLGNPKSKTSSERFLMGKRGKMSRGDEILELIARFEQILCKCSRPGASRK